MEMVKAEVQETQVVRIEEGIYEGVFMGIEEIETKFGKSWRWKFNVEADKEVHLITGLTSARLTTRSKAYAWVKALTGKEIKAGDVIDFDKLIGKKALVEVGDRNFRDSVISNILNVMKLPKTKKGGRQ